MRSRAAIVDIPDDVQPGDSQSLDQMSDRGNELTCTRRFDDRIDNAVEVLRPVRIVFLFNQQFRNDLFESSR